jgi:hypothetical protein
MEDRRTHDRHQVFLPAEIEAREGKFQVGITQDMSRSGALLLTRARIKAGDDVRIYVMLEDNAREAVQGRVVRKTDTFDKGIWSHEVAVHFSEHFPGAFDERLEEIARAQASIFGN